MLATATIPMRAYDFTVWKTVKLGTHKSLADLKIALEKKGVILAAGSSVILTAPEFVLSAEEKELDLVRVTLEELGFKGDKGVDHWDVLKRAHEIGLRLCPPAVGPALALICEKEDLTDRYGLVIGMPLMADPWCNPQTFFLCYEEEYSSSGEYINATNVVVLSGAHDGPDYRWHRTTTGIFVKLRQ